MFITLEGIEGSGKTTQIQLLADFLKAQGRDCVLTREPGGTEIGEKIRTILLDPASKDLVPMAELLLYAADRAQHVDSLIKPWLEEGKTVICDRFLDATIVYQGFARGLDIEQIRLFHQPILAGLIPDITILLDLPVQVGLERAWKRIRKAQDATDARFEKETRQFHEKVRCGYLALARQEPKRFCIVDGASGQMQVQAAIQQEVMARFEQNT